MFCKTFVSFNLEFVKSGARNKDNGRVFEPNEKAFLIVGFCPRSRQLFFPVYIANFRAGKILENIFYERRNSLSILVTPSVFWQQKRRPIKSSWSFNKLKELNIRKLLYFKKFILIFIRLMYIFSSNLKQPRLR